MDLIGNEGIPIGDKPEDEAARQTVLRFLSAVPGLVETMRQANVQDVFRVVMSNENAHLFKQGADGLYKPFLRDGGKFVENVNLAKVAPDYSKITTELAAQMQMAALMAKLDRIERAVEKVGNDNQDARRNDVAGSIVALIVAHSLNDPHERRQQVLLSCNNATKALKVLAGQLRSNIRAMPERSGLLEGVFNDPSEDARKAFDLVAADIAVLVSGCKAVLNAYERLGERAAARVAFDSFLKDIEASGLEDAARKARLVPGKKGTPLPETVVTWFGSAAKDLDRHLINDERSSRPLAIRMDIKVSDLEVQPWQK